MATFAYTGRTRGGETVTGERIADSMDAAVAALRREQVQVTKITPAKEKAAAKAEAKKAGGRRGRRRAGRCDEALSENVRSAVYQYDRRRRSGRYSRHDSQASLDLH